jgi:DeoR/GlpR family transcriptional regulator of sugar metabolism
MLPAERCQHISDELYKKKVISVNHLAQWLDVIPMTIRRDLQLLEEQRLVKKATVGLC